MPRPPKFSGEDESSNETVRHSARYFVADLKTLSMISKASGIWPGTWLRNLLHQMVQLYKRKGFVPVPFVVVGQEEAERAGLVPPLSSEPSEGELPEDIRG
jgi:hypothetical protein